MNLSGDGSDAQLFGAVFPDIAQGFLGNAELPCWRFRLLNSGALTAFGGCAHWVTVNFSNSI